MSVVGTKSKTQSFSKRRYASLDGVSGRGRTFHVPVRRVQAPLRARPSGTPAAIRRVLRSAPRPHPAGASALYRLPLLSALLVSVFLSGMWVVLGTPWGRAQWQPPDGQVLGASVEAPAEPVPEADVLCQTPIEELTSLYVSPTTAEVVVERKRLLTEFLKRRGSPFVEYADVIAEQPHWKLIMAISFAESTLGKRCSGNNCSGIGVAPGHQLWRTYPSFKEWILDFNRLLDSRYRDWSLEEMCGVYVKPCNRNWLAATRQMLAELEEAGIR